MSISQLPLSLSLREDATFASYYVASNQMIIDTLQASASGQGESFVFLLGATGEGRSHLLQATCHHATTLGRSAIYLPLEYYNDYTPAVFEELEQYDLVCLDDIDCLIGMPEWEEALFHLYNRLRQAGSYLVVSASALPAELPCCFEDLRSRLSWGLLFQIKPMQDDEKLVALTLRASARGLELSEEVGRYLLHHYARSLERLFAVLDQLDQAALIAKRRLTIPFVKQTLL